MNYPMILVLVVLAGCQSRSAQPEVALRNALVIQADFGGLAMAGVAYDVSRDLDIFTLPQLIPLYDIAAASRSLEYTADTWPSGTVLVSVVDPGVGTERKSVVLKTKSGHYFVSPDNGSLSGPAAKYGIEAVREIDESINRREGSEWSHTFHGRDVYTYTGARLAAGVISYEQVGPSLEPKVIMLANNPATFKEGVLQGSVRGGIGRLGNVEFTIDRQLFKEIQPSLGDRFRITISNETGIVWQDTVPYVKSFGAVPVGDLLLFVNSSGFMSTAINQGNFAQTFDIQAGPEWVVNISK